MMIRELQAISLPHFSSDWKPAARRWGRNYEHMSRGWGGCVVVLLLCESPLFRTIPRNGHLFLVANSDFGGDDFFVIIYWEYRYDRKSLKCKKNALRLFTYSMIRSNEFLYLA